MDLCKAFDTVSHKILLNKLHYYGISGPAHALIKGYISSKKQFVAINNTSSSLENIEIGVRQDSILGSLLFLIYKNDLGNATLSKPRLFANDTCLVLSISSLSKLEDNCNRELNNLKKWCNANKLKINPEKSAVVLVPSKFNLQTRKFDVTYNNNPSICLSSSKYCGVFIDDKLNFKSHIEHSVSKISRSIGILNKLRFFSISLLYFFYIILLVTLIYYLVYISGAAPPNSFYPSYRNSKTKQFELSQTPKQNPI